MTSKPGSRSIVYKSAFAPPSATRSSRPCASAPTTRAHTSGQTTRAVSRTPSTTATCALQTGSRRPRLVVERWGGHEQQRRHRAGRARVVDARLQEPGAEQLKVVVHPLGASLARSRSRRRPRSARRRRLQIDRQEPTPEGRHIRNYILSYYTTNRHRSGCRSRTHRCPSAVKKAPCSHPLGRRFCARRSRWVRDALCQWRRLRITGGGRREAGSPPAVRR